MFIQFIPLKKTVLTSEFVATTYSFYQEISDNDGF